MSHIIPVRRLAVFVLWLGWITDLPAQTTDPVLPGFSGEQLEFFEKSVRPLLVERCYDCHSTQSERVRGSLYLDSREGVLIGGDLGPAAVPGEPGESLLIEAVRYDDPLFQMPPNARLHDREIAILEEWVRMGMPDPRGIEEPAPTEHEHDLSEPWWSFQPVRDAEPPAVVDEQWPRDPIDRFLLATLEAEGMRPAPEDDRPTLIRRVTFDLIGLPPTPDEIDAFLDDDSADAFEKVVDRLLSSSHHGERWGRHWLDVVRYADTSGCNGDFPIPEAYRYRDYVIESINQDKPFDRFLAEQVAGDLLPAGSDEQRHEQTIATGYLAISRRFSSVAEEFHLTIDDTIDNLGKAALGLSVSCARCHDHKFDPIPQKDYFALYGIFESTRYAFPGTEIYRHTQDLVPLVPEDRLNQELRPFLDRMEEMDSEMLRVYTLKETLDNGSKEKNQLNSQWKQLQEERDELVKSLPAYEKAFAVSEGEPTNALLHLKGDPERPGSEVSRGFLQVLGGQVVPEDEPGSGRRQLAIWLTDPNNPLTARVIVNRVWQRHFGQGIVRTPNDFGTRGAPPTHPELLDFLASRFVEEGWSLKALHRRIVLSSAYRMASIEDPEFARQDPENKALWTFPRRRLDAEEIRDAILAVSGSLDRSPGGPHPFPPELDWRYSQHRPFVDDYPTLRRSVFLMQQRIRLQPFLAIFDGADTNVSTDRRLASTMPQQALFLLNSEFVHEQAARFASRLASRSDRPEDRITMAFLLAFGRPPTEAEIDDSLEYLRHIEMRLIEAGIPEGERSEGAWSSYARVLLSSNEFVFVD